MMLHASDTSAAANRPPSHNLWLQASHTHTKVQAVAALLSLVWSGAGQVYAGAIDRGIWMIGVGFFLFLGVTRCGVAIIFALPFWIWCMFDARTQSLKHNQAVCPMRTITGSLLA